jgi:gluconolactonase
MLTRYLPVSLALLEVSAAMAQPQTDLTGILAPGAEVRKLAGGFQFTEGPAWDGKGNLYFSDIPANTVYRMDMKGDFAAFLQPSENSNGLAFDAKGNLIACRHQARDVVRISQSGWIEVLADSYQGKKLNSPNDCVVAKDGAIYFTDPRFGLGNRPQEQDAEGVYRIAPSGELTRVASDMTRPNGLAISPDGKTLYVADSADMKMRAYPLEPDGSAGEGRDFAIMKGPGRGVPDGMTLDEDGRVYCTGAGGIWVFTPGGEHLGTIAVPEVPANCAFGGADERTLFITAQTSVYELAMAHRGLR